MACAGCAARRWPAVAAVPPSSLRLDSLPGLLCDASNAPTTLNITNNRHHSTQPTQRPTRLHSNFTHTPPVTTSSSGQRRRSRSSRRDPRYHVTDSDRGTTRVAVAQPRPEYDFALHAISSSTTSRPPPTCQYHCRQRRRKSGHYAGCPRLRKWGPARRPRDHPWRAEYA